MSWQDKIVLKYRPDGLQYRIFQWLAAPWLILIWILTTKENIHDSIFLSGTDIDIKTSANTPAFKL